MVTLERKKVHWQGCIESNNYQQGWFVPQDIEGMIQLMGKQYFEEELIAFLMERTMILNGGIITITLMNLTITYLSC